MKRILKLTSFILLCAMLLSFAACDMAVENGDASDSDSDAVGSEEIPSDKVTEKNTEKKTDKKRHSHEHKNPFKERFMKQQNEQKGYTPIRQYSLFDETDE